MIIILITAPNLYLTFISDSDFDSIPVYRHKSDTENYFNCDTVCHLFLSATNSKILKFFECPIFQTSNISEFPDIQIYESEV